MLGGISFHFQVHPRQCFDGQSQSLDFSTCKRSFLLGLADLNVAGKIRCFS
jgi:hypothetical protein